MPEGAAGSMETRQGDGNPKNELPRLGRKDPKEGKEFQGPGSAGSVGREQ